MLATLIAAVAAATPLLHDGDPAWAERAVHEVAPGAALAPRSWLSLSRAEPVLVSGAEVRRCRTVPLTREQLLARLDAARSDLDWGEYAAAEAAVSTLLDDLPCLTEPIRRAELARAGRLLGAARFYQDDEEGASAAFAALRSQVPDAGWDDTLPDPPRTLLDATPPRLPVPLTVVPEEEVLLVDGSPALEVPPGEHLVQWRGPSGAVGLWVDLPEEGAQLALPAALEGLPLDELARDPLSGLPQVLSGTWGPGTPVWVVTTRAVYRGDAGDSLEEVGPAPEPPGKGLRWTVPVLAVGGASTLAGGVGAGLSLLAVERARTDYQTARTGADAVDARTRFDRASGWVAPTEVALVAGAAVLSTGLVLHFGTRVGVVAGPAGARVGGRF